MNHKPPAGVIVEEPSSPPVSQTVAAGLLAMLGYVALLDAAVETFMSGSSIRWWVTAPSVAFVALNVWLWRSGGPARRRFGAGGAAAMAIGAVPLLLAATAWLPGGQIDGVRILGQPTATVLIAMTAAAVMLAVSVLSRALAMVPAPARTIARLVLLAVAFYALTAFGLALSNHTPFADLLHGAGLWRPLPRWLQGAYLGSFVLLPLALLVRLMEAGRQPRGTRGRAAQPVVLAQSVAVVLAGYLAVGAGGRAVGTPNVSTANLSTVSIEDAIKASEQFRAAVLTASDGSPLTAALARERLQYLLEQFAALEREVPRETFAPQAVVDSVGRDPALLFAWVRDRTFWIPYRGALRGPVGVLMDRAGNSLDRSLLLAELLRLAGYSVRLAHADLTPDQAASLRERLAAVPELAGRVPSMTETWSARSDQVFQEYAQRFQKDPAAFVQSAARLTQIDDARTAEARRQSAVQAQALRAALGNAQGNAPAADATKELADHWWVQFSRDGQWVDVDLGARDATAGHATAAVQSTVAPASLPEGDYWTVEVRVVLERWSRGQLSEHTVLTHRFRAIDTILQDVTLLHAPKNFPDKLNSGDDRAAELRSAILAVNEWRPVLVVGNKPVAGPSFGNDGSVKAQEGLAGSGDLLGGLTGGTGGDETDNAGVLTAEWIDYEIRGPGTQGGTTRRESFDLIGPAARARRSLPTLLTGESERLQRSQALLGQTAILVQVAQPSAEFLAHRVIRRVCDNRIKILGLARTDAGAPTPRARNDDARGLFARLMPRSDSLWQYAALRFKNHELGGDVYLDRPSISTIHSTVAPSAEGDIVRRERFDIVSNGVAVRPGSNSPPFRIRVDQGVADTIAERLALNGSSTAENTAAIFAAASAQGIGAVVVRHSEAASMPAGLPADVLARIRADLSAGYEVVMPKRMVTFAEGPRIGWWRVTPDDGLSVGVMDTGFRQGLSEYKVGRALLFGAVLGVAWVWADETVFLPLRNMLNVVVILGGGDKPPARSRKLTPYEPR